MTLDELISAAKAADAAMTPEQRDAMMRAQRASFVRGQLAFGSDADEAEYRRRLRAGEPLHDTPSGAPAFKTPAATVLEFAAAVRDAARRLDDINENDMIQRQNANMDDPASAEQNEWFDGPYPWQD